MSVPKYRRNESQAEFVNKAFELNISLYGLVSKMPKKLQKVYGEKMLELGLELQENVSIGNGIYICKTTTQLSFEERIRRFEIAKGIIYDIHALYQIVIEIIIKNLHYTNDEINKYRNNAVKVYDICEEETKLISGIIKHDKEIFKECQLNGK